jgi:hypothetical protein
MDTDRSAVGKRSGAGTMQPPNESPGRPQRRIRQPPRLVPQDQYAEGILSLSKSNAETLFAFCGEIPMKAGGNKTNGVFHSRCDLELHADTIQPGASMPVEDGSLNI